jgi:RNA polymerase sigma factor (sigma-70 family)
MNMTDGELLQRYVRDRSETAFAELVRRHLSLVYSAALRQVNGDTQLAEDVTQSVFTDLARKAAKLVSHPSLTAWLYTSTRFVAANTRRTERRRSTREQEALAMNTMLSLPEPQPEWLQLRPLLDEAMHQLDEPDREAVLLRHFENCSFAEIGKKIGLTENAARMRVDRALERLHVILAKQGTVFTLAILAGLLSANAVGAAPARLAIKVISRALATTAGSGVATAFWSKIFAAAKANLAVVATTAVLIAMGVLFYESESHTSFVNNTDKSAAAAANSDASNLPASNPSDGLRSKARVRDTLTLRLKMVTADGGKPIPNVPISYLEAVGVDFKEKQFTSDRFGECDVDYPTNITELKLTTRKDGFADTRLQWRPSRGDTIPSNYIVRIEWAVAMSGRVVDTAGKPVAGAEVRWGYMEDPVTRKLPQNHYFDSIGTFTDEQGKWQLNRIAKELIPLISGGATHSNYCACTVADGAGPLEKQFREGSHVFILTPGVTATGIVLDSQGNPVPDASIQVGRIGEVHSRQGRAKSDGTFEVDGCESGQQLITASAAGFAAATIMTNLAENANPLSLTLKPGKTLRVRVMDNFGNPIPKAMVCYDSLSGWPSVQADINLCTGPQGRVRFSNAPDLAIKLNVDAAGFAPGGATIRPDDEEHIVRLQNALIVHGSVRDAATGEPIPKVRIVQGWPREDFRTGTTNLEWSSIDRFWLDFSGGTFTNAFSEGLRGDPSEVYLKFMADGYQPFVARAVRPAHGGVELDAALHRGTTTTVTVYQPNGLPAALADIGLISPGARLRLNQGGFSQEYYTHSGGALLRTAANGTFVLPPDDSVTRVVAASPDGYIESTPAALMAQPVLQMLPWGRLEVTCNHGKAVSGRGYTLSTTNVPPEITCFFAIPMTPDSQGRMTVEKLPPGDFLLVGHNSCQNSPGNFAYLESDRTPFDIRAGETTSLVLGISNVTVRAHLVWPAGMPRQPSWLVFGRMHTPEPDLADESRAITASQKEYAQLRVQAAASCSVPATITPDDFVRIEAVTAGEYELSLSVYAPSSANSSSNAGVALDFKKIAAGVLPVTIPADPDSETVDLGEVHPTFLEVRQ